MLSPNTLVYRGLTNPRIPLTINKIPMDILRLIFHASLSAEWPGVDHTRSSLRLSHVCKRWRMVAHDDTLLWKSVTIDSDVVDLASYSLDRSGNTPIFMTVKISPPDNVDFGVNPSMQLLQGHLHRVKSLVIEMDPEGLLRILSLFPALTSSVTPLLSRLHIHSQGGADNNDLVDRMTSLPLYANPSPQVLDIGFSNLAPALSSPVWDGIRQVKLNGLMKPLEDYFKIIMRSPLLEHVSITGGVEAGDLTSIPNITATKLRVLRLVGWFASGIESFLNKVSMPNLEEGRFDVDSSSEMSFFDLFSGQFAQPYLGFELFSHIQSLKLIFPTADDPEEDDVDIALVLEGWGYGAPFEGKYLFESTLLFYHPDIISGVLRLFPNLLSFTTAHPSGGLSWDLGSSPTIRTFRIEGRGKDSLPADLHELIERQCLPRLDRVELFEFECSQRVQHRLCLLIDALVRNSAKPSLSLVRSQDLDSEVLQQLQCSGISVEYNGKMVRERYVVLQNPCRYVVAHAPRI
jgi:F-box-like